MSPRHTHPLIPALAAVSSESDLESIALALREAERMAEEGPKWQSTLLTQSEAAAWWKKSLPIERGMFS